MKRRNFVKACGYSASATGLLSGCKQQTVAAQYLPNNDKQLQLEKSLIKPGHSHLIRYPDSKYPIAVSQLPDLSYSACLMDCSHQHCETSPSDEGFICPCHGARYSLSGQVVKGPAKVSLKTFAVSQANGQLLIQLD